MSHWKINENISIDEILDEPNVRVFNYNNHVCVVVRTSHGHFNGYVGVTEESTLFGVDYNDLREISVHGGLTYSSDTLHNFPIFSNKIWWFGFDTVHNGDQGIYTFGSFNNVDDIYRNYDYVLQQVISLSDQLKEENNE